MSEDIGWNDVQACAAKGKDAKLNAQHVLDLLQELRDIEKERDAVKDELEKMKQDFSMQSIQLEKLGEELKKAPKADEFQQEINSLRGDLSQARADVASKQQLMTQLETDIASTREKLDAANARLESANVDDLKARVSRMEVVEQENADLKVRIEKIQQDNVNLKAKLDELGSAGPGPDVATFEAEKAAFEAEKKRLFKEMEDFEVSLRMEMEKKDEQIADLEAALRSPGARAPEPPPSTVATPEVTRESMLAKLGLGAGGFQPEDDGMMVVAGGGRVTCPKCGNTNVKVESDRSRVLSYTGGMPIYAKKYSCKKCILDFRVD